MMVVMKLIAPSSDELIKKINPISQSVWPLNTGLCPGPVSSLARRCAEAIYQLPAAPGRDRPVPAHQHHQAKSKEQEHQAAKPVLDPDHFVVGGKDVFSPPPELVMLMSGVVPVRFVMCF